MVTENLHDPLVHTTVDGRYHIERKIGAGNMGVVYKATHLTLDKQVALKILSPRWAYDKEASNRLFREARAASKLNHPNIVEAIDLGSLRDNRPYLVMEYCEGQDLKAHFNEMKSIDFDLCIQVTGKIGEVLDALHAEDMIHRDVKPHNILLAPKKDGSYIIKLSDFGLASLMVPNRHMPKITRNGEFPCTPAYASPEVGNVDALDGRADVYSLATIAYLLIKGDLPFEAKTPLKLLWKKAEQDPPPLSKGIGGKKVPIFLEQVMAKGLARDRNQRYLTAGEFARDLRKALTDFALTFPPEVRFAIMPSLKRAVQRDLGTDFSPEGRENKHIKQRTNKLSQKQLIMWGLIFLMSNILAFIGGYLSR